MLCRMALIRSDVSEELSASIITETRISEIETLAVSSNRLTLRRSAAVYWFLSPWLWRRYVPPKRLFLQEPLGVTFQKTPFFIVAAEKTSNLTLMLVWVLLPTLPSLTTGRYQEASAHLHTNISLLAAHQACHKLRPFAVAIRIYKPLHYITSSSAD
jgi:hypothetical protein